MFINIVYDQQTRLGENKAMRIGQDGKELVFPEMHSTSFRRGISYAVPVIIVIVLILSFAAGYFAGIGNTNTTTQVSTTTVTTSFTNIESPVCVSVGNCSETLVYIPYGAHFSRYQFPMVPGNITVLIGVNNTVMWMNLDTLTHTLSGTVLNIGSLAPGATYSYTFTTPGIYTYSSPTYPWLDGMVTVVQSNGAASVPGSNNNY